MSQLTIEHLERTLASPGAMPYGYAYVETGRYKPYNVSTVKAAQRRGYRVETLRRNVYAVYPQGSPPEPARPHNEQPKGESQ